MLFHKKEKTEKVFQFLICLDFLVKGVLIHGQLKASGKGDKSLTTDAKFPILLGDQYHSMAYYMITRLGNLELTKLLVLVEEGFWKIFFNIEKFSTDIHKNLQFLYEHFYNYLPQFFSHCFKGLGLIYDMGPDGILQMGEVGV